MVCSGFSAVIGSWNIMPMRSPRSAHIAVVVERRQFLAVEADRAGDLRALGQQAHQRQRGDRLAAARFADQAQRVAALERERHAAQRIGRAARRSAA